MAALAGAEGSGEGLVGVGAVAASEAAFRAEEVDSAAGSKVGTADSAVALEVGEEVALGVAVASRVETGEVEEDLGAEEGSREEVIEALVGREGQGGQAGTGAGRVGHHRAMGQLDPVILENEADGVQKWTECRGRVRRTSWRGHGEQLPARRRRWTRLRKRWSGALRRWAGRRWWLWRRKLRWTRRQATTLLIVVTLGPASRGTMCQAVTICNEQVKYVKVKRAWALIWHVILLPSACCTTS